MVRDGSEVESKPRIRVLVVDDHAVVRRGLRQLIEETSDMVVTGEAGNGREAMELVRSNEFDVAVLDINMPGQDGLDTLRQLKAESRELPVLVLSMHSEDVYAVRVVSSGAGGYMCKESAPDELVSAIRKIAAGGRYVSPRLGELLLNRIHTPEGAPLHAALSDRELQVLCLLSSGKTVGEIAEELALSVKTISTYRARILQKMHMRTNSELTQYAIREALVP